MFSWSEFASVVPAITGVTIDAAAAGDVDRENPNQKGIVEARPDTSLFVIAGPGSGKTTSAALRILKLVYVNGLPPASIFATTFTRRAAAVLRSRITSWGEDMREALAASHPDRRALLDLLDLNRIRVGTLDSLAQEVLNDNKRAGDPRPTPVEDLVLTSLMLTEAVFQSPASTRGGSDSAPVGAFLHPFFPRFSGSDPGRAQALIQLRQRLINDQIDRQGLRASADASTDEGRGLLASLDCIQHFEEIIAGRELYDFSAINQAFLEGLTSGRLDEFLRELRFVLVDEYQDTNYLQEKIYFSLAEAAAKAGGSIMVVGDDDQSLYRFRGATVELFSNFENRLSNRTGIAPTRIALDRNYRSTPQIVAFVNSYVELDPEYAGARVAGKPRLTYGGGNPNSCPIFGLFRDTEEQVAQSLSNLVAKLRRGESILVPDQADQVIEIALDPSEGSAGDIAVLTYSAKEFGDRTQAGLGRRRFPRKLRDALASQTPSVPIFNPRGSPLQEIPAVQELLGNVLDCIDEDESILQQVNAWTASKNCLAEWRNLARARRPSRSPELGSFVTHWSRRQPTRNVQTARVSLNDIIFKLIKWLPDFQSDIEHLAWLEAIQRAVSTAAVLQGFTGDLLFDTKEPKSDLAVASVKQIYRRILLPLAEGIIEVSEDILETLPLDRVNVMTIHQSKGLEFPITVVDVGTALEDLRWMQRKSRYPTGPDLPHQLEDSFRPFSDIGVPDRPALYRTFDDLARNYFVAFSRAQDVLILAGHRNSQRPKTSGRPAEHVASGWIRPTAAQPAGQWPWSGMSFLTLIEDEHL
jgi:DNA helicase II / ATP-dependent DNA helicase PcrA